jgi:TatD DNase family protein
MLIFSASGGTRLGQTSISRENQIMKIFDSHCHLDDKSYEKDLGDVIARARKAGVIHMTVIGINKRTSAKAVSLAESFKDLYATVGVHPHDARNCSASVLNYLSKLCQHPKVVAWGEIGLDFNRMYSPRRDQERWFRKQLEIADERGLPLIFHERDSEGRFIEILNAHPNRKRQGVVHCFSGNRKDRDQYLDLGFCIGITGIVTMKERGESLRKLVRDIPAQRLLVETDAPYLVPAPEKNRTRRNEPAFVKSVLLKLAEVRGEDPADLAKIIWENTCRLYAVK